MSATKLSERDGHGGPWGQSAPRSQHRSVAELSTNGSGRTPFAKRAATQVPHSVHLPSSAHCVAPARKLPHCPKGAHSVGGSKEKAKEGEVSQVPQEAWGDCHSPPPHVPPPAVQRVRQDSCDHHLTQHQGLNWSQKAPKSGGHQVLPSVLSYKSRAVCIHWPSETQDIICALVSLWGDLSYHSSPCSSHGLRGFLLFVWGYLVIYLTLPQPETRPNKSQLLLGIPVPKSVLH